LFIPSRPTRTVDLKVPTGSEIQIEERHARRSTQSLRPRPDPLTITRCATRPSTVTPQRYLAGIVTERGIVLPPFRDNLPKAIHGEPARSVKTAK